MAVSNAAIFPQKIQAWTVQLTNALGTAITQLVAAGANGSIVESLQVTLTDSVANNIAVYIQDGSAVNHQIGNISIPATSGANSGVPAVDILRSGMIPGLPVDANGNFVLYVPSGFKIMVQSGVAPGVGKVFDVVAMGADY